MYNNLRYKSLVSVSRENAFIIGITTISDNQDFVMPFMSIGTFNLSIDWGDGSPIDLITTWNQAERTHTYATAGNYTIRMEGQMGSWSFLNVTTSRSLLTDIKNWGIFNTGNQAGAFRLCNNLQAQISATDAPRFAEFGITSCLAFFSGCPLFNSDIGHWNVSTITNFGGGAAGANLGMFFQALAFNNGGSPSINNWNVSSGVNFQNMFNSSSNGAFNQPIGNWNMSNALRLDGMFIRQISFNQNIGDWNVSNVTHFIGTFQDCSAFNNGGNDSIKNWQFRTTGSLTLLAMFINASSFNQPIGTWNMQQVTSVENMLRNCSAFNQDIGDWNVSNVTNFSNFMLGKTFNNYSSANLDSIYNKWSLLSLQSNRNIHFGTIRYTSAGAAGRATLVNTFGWTITDGGQI